MATAVAAAARPILLLALITSVDFWATDSDLGLAYTEMKDGDGDKVGPSSGLMYLHTSSVTTSYYTREQCQTLTTRQYSVNVVTTYAYSVKLVTTHK